MAKNLEGLLSPKAIAIVGASSAPEKVGAIVLKNIIQSGFTGHIYPINPHEPKIGDLQCFPDVKSLPEVVDLVVIAIPSSGVNEVLTACGEKSIKNVVVFSAGYKEIGAEGKALEDSLIQTAQKYGLNVLGPNCLGFVSKTCPVNATFGEDVKQTGNLRFVSQSGALAASLFDFCNATGLGFREFVTLGNKAVINENDVLNHFLEQDKSLPENEQFPIGLYLESISDGKELLGILKQLTLKNPVFIIKPGKTPAAAKAMQSHTGAIAGADNVLRAALKQTGVTHCESLEDYFDLSRAFSWEKAPMGPKVAIVSNAGGPAVISADAVESEGLQLAEFDDETRKKLQEALPRYASVLDPVDVLGDALADRIAKASEIILQTGNANALVVILTPQVMTQIEKTAEMIGDLGKKYQIPIFCSFIGGSLVAEGEKKLNEMRIPSFRFPERAISAIALMWQWKKWQIEQSQIPQSGTAPQISDENKSKIQGIVNKALGENQTSLCNTCANDILGLGGIPTPPTMIVNNLDEAKKFAADNVWPVVLKLSSPGLLHKTDVGGVINNISSDDELATAMINLDHKINDLPDNLKANVSKQIQKGIVYGIEVIVGIKRDPTFGPVLLFGAGGKLAELIMDRNLHLLPLDLNSVKQVVEQSKIYTMLKGYRGEPPFALDKLYDAILKLGALMETMPDVSEIEMNPLFVTQNDVWAVDGKVVFGPPTAVKPMPIVPVSRFKVAEALECTTLAGKYHNFIFKTDPPIVFKPGQYVSIKVADTRINSYSIADHMSSENFGLLIDTSPGGPGSKYFENLKVGDKISYLGPFGIFTYKDDGAKQLLFLGTGSGLSPLRCIIDDLLKTQHVQTPITLYLGLRFPTDVFWKDYFENLEKEFPNFHFVLAISKPDASWTGKTGHVTDLVAQDFPDASLCSAYLCGNKMMVEETSNILISHGCKKERVYSEKF
jgi:acyl-CoA synthetase (NDP forming)/NAD(P)H-flavin reductase